MGAPGTATRRPRQRAPTFRRRGSSRPRAFPRGPRCRDERERASWADILLMLSDDVDAVDRIAEAEAVAAEHLPGSDRPEILERVVVQPELRAALPDRRRVTVAAARADELEHVGLRARGRGKGARVVHRRGGGR